MHLHFDRDTPTIASSSMKIVRNHHCENKLTTSFASINLSAEMTQHMIAVLTVPSTNHTNSHTLQNQHPQHKPLRNSPTHRNTHLKKKKIGQYKNNSKVKSVCSPRQRLCRSEKVTPDPRNEKVHHSEHIEEANSRKH